MCTNDTAGACEAGPVWLLHLYLTFGESTSKASTWSACMVGLRTGTRARVKPQARATLDVAVVVTDRVCRICVLARLYPDERRTPQG